jgi:hypothetical protein
MQKVLVSGRLVLEGDQWMSYLLLFCHYSAHHVCDFFVVAPFSSFACADPL